MKRFLALFLLGLLSLSGCTAPASAPVSQTSPPSQQAPATTPQTNPSPQTPQTPQIPQAPPPSAVPVPPKTKTVKATLYFPDSQAQYLVPVARQIKVTDGAIVKAIIIELQKGDTRYGKVIPAEAKLLQAWVKDGIVHLNFSKEFRTKHWGGSSGESMTIYSIVNTLTSIKDVKAVQFYLEGKVEDSILGHADTRNPYYRNTSLIKQ